LWAGIFGQVARGIRRSRRKAGGGVGLIAGRRCGPLKIGGAHVGCEAEPQIHQAALLPGEGEVVDQEESPAAFQAIDEVHEGRVLPAHAGVHANLGQPWNSRLRNIGEMRDPNIVLTGYVVEGGRYRRIFVRKALVVEFAGLRARHIHFFG